MIVKIEDLSLITSLTILKKPNGSFILKNPKKLERIRPKPKKWKRRKKKKEDEASGNGD